jgi:L-iditol 2-dehydrogenase
MRAVALDSLGRPVLSQLPLPRGDGELIRVRACGLCGSDVEKLGRAPAGTVLGHEVAGERTDGRRVALVHHLPCGACDRCLSGHESTCERFGAATIVPGGFAERVRATAWIDVPEEIDDALATYAEPLACVLRGAERVPAGRVLVVGQGFVGRLFDAVLRHRGDDVFSLDPNPARPSRPPGTTVDAAVLCAPAGAAEAAERLEPGGTLLAFANAGPLDLDAVYRRELTVAGSRSATPRHMERAVELLGELDLPPPTVLPLERFSEGLDLYRSARALKVVFKP